MSFSNRVKSFNRWLSQLPEIPLPEGIAMMNPFAEKSIALRCADAFYDKFYNDENPRIAILGINPGRHGAALTGVPFTDFKRLEKECGIDPLGQKSHEPSSEFVYEVVNAMGGPQAFYSRYYINSVCPLGFVQQKNKGWVNYNYYDDKALYAAVRPFIIESLQQQMALGLDRKRCICMGKKNLEFLKRLNEELGLFEEISEVPHPRFVVQYKRKEMPHYVAAYVEKLIG